MSLQTINAQPRLEPRPSPARRLHPVEAPTPRRRPKLAYAALAVAGALAIGAAQMAISVATTQDAFVLAQLTAEQHELGLQKQALREELAGLSSPQSLAAKADALGLVVAGSASYLRLSDGQVLGAGHGADWASTVNPNGAHAVANSLLVPPPAPESEGDVPPDAAAQDAAPALPPTVDDGLPSPATR